jgi:Fe-S-cluster containining protein
MENGFSPLAGDDSFCFSCSSEVPCFTECCRNLNQFLTPYDILRLKACLGLPSHVFLNRFAVRHTGPETGFPVFSFKTDPGLNPICPFLTDAGCRVYHDRPTSCRLYPIARAVSRSRETGKTTEHLAILKESHCQGHHQQKRQTVREWMDTQELQLYNSYNDMILELIHLKNRMKSGPLNPDARRRFSLALYDLDAFRDMAFDKGFFETLTLDRETYERATQEDTALLQVGINWLKETIFKTKTLQNGPTG